MNGFLNKVKGAFVQADSIEIDEEFLQSFQQETIPIIAQTTGDLLTIKDIYIQNNINDLSRSIFKINEIKSVLPESLPNESKKSSVEGTMKLFGLDKESVIDDANNRIQVLKAVGESIANETINIIEESQLEIQQFETQINELRSKITNRKKLQEDQDKMIVDEVFRITEIHNFIK